MTKPLDDLTHDPIGQSVRAVEAFATQLRYPIDWPTPVLPDELLEALGDFYQEARLWSRGVRFLCFCHTPELFGFLRPIECGTEPNELRLLSRQRFAAARAAHG